MKTNTLERATRLIAEDLEGPKLLDRTRALIAAVAFDDEHTARLIMSLEYPQPRIQDL